MVKDNILQRQKFEITLSYLLLQIIITNSYNFNDKSLLGIKVFKCFYNILLDRTSMQHIGESNKILLSDSCILTCVSFSVFSNN